MSLLRLLWKLDDVVLEDKSTSRKILATVVSRVVAACENASISVNDRAQILASGLQLAVSALDLNHLSCAYFGHDQLREMEMSFLTVHPSKM